MPDSTRSAAEAAAAVGCDVGQIVKSLVFRADGQEQPLLALVSGADRLDPAKLAVLAGAPVEQANADWIRERTGFAIGGVAPVGHTGPVTSYLDRRLMEHDVVWAAAGTPRSVFPIAPGELLRITAATLGDIAVG